MKEMIGNVVVWLIMSLMVCMAHYLGLNEIVFPEIGAVAVGLLLIDKNMWHVGKLQVVLLLVAEACAGLLIMRYLGHLPLLCTIPISFVTATLILYLSGISMLPGIAACLMPVILNVTSWYYVAGVAALSILVVVALSLLEFAGFYSNRIPFIIARMPFSNEKLTRWVSLLVCLMPVVAVAQYSGWLYIIAPPLVVTFIEFSNSKSGFRQRPMQVLVMMVIASLASSLMLYAGVAIDIPVCAIAMAVVFVTLSMFHIFRKYFAPALAVAILPLHVPHDMLLSYPLQIGVGCASLIILSSVPYLVVRRWNFKS